MKEEQRRMEVVGGWLKRGVGGRRRVDYSIFGNAGDIRRGTKTHGNKVLKSRSTIPKSERKKKKERTSIQHNKDNYKYL